MTKLTELLEKAKQDKRISAAELLSAMAGMSDDQVGEVYARLEADGVEIDTEGGHSYGAFGNRNAIAYLASLIDTLYTIKVPEKGRTTYNVGTISGGTSVNTIAQHAEMLYEFRSDERESLEIMERHFLAAIEFYRTKGIAVTVTLVGDRPCAGGVDREKIEEMMARADAASKRH